MSEPGKKKLKIGARTAFKNVGGPTERRGDPAIAELLERAFEVSEADHELSRAHVHGFHSYPARLHPIIAARLLSSFASPGKTLLDPFCGSGTVLVEARLLGVRAVGTDVNPLALRLARLKGRGVPEVEQRALVDAARWVEQHVERRRVGGARVTHKYEQEDVDLFEPHVLLELDSIRDGIDGVEPRALREDLELVLSAILTKVSRRLGDTGRYLEPRRLAPGYVARFLVAKAEELARALEDFRRRLPPNAPPIDVHSDDARVLGTIGEATVDLVLTSPPYAATYDYLDHHDMRLRWLRMRSDRFDTLELGARRTYAALHVKAAQERWNDELGRTLVGIARARRTQAMCIIVIADSAVHGFALRADEIVEAQSKTAGLAVAAMASQVRPHFHGGTRQAFASAPRKEHLIALRR